MTVAEIGFTLYQDHPEEPPSPARGGRKQRLREARREAVTDQSVYLYYFRTAAGTKNLTVEWEPEPDSSASRVEKVFWRFHAFMKEWKEAVFEEYAEMLG